METVVKFAKLRGDAKIPSKRDEDAGLDIYACFDEQFMVIKPHETKIIPTGIASACNKEYCLIVKERGSTGSKGIAVRMGVIDSGYRDGIMIGLTNTTDHILFITKLNDSDTVKVYAGYNTNLTEDIFNSTPIFYPYTKAVAQILVLPVPHTTIEEVSYEELKSIESKRGLGKLGSSNK